MPIYILEIMNSKEDNSKDLRGFSEDQPYDNESSSRPQSHRRLQPRLRSAGSKSRKGTQSRTGQGSVQKIKSSMFTLKDLRKAKLQQREDNLPTIEFDNVKWISIISAYDPGRLKNITVKKEGFEQFFGKHNPNQDPLGQLYIQSVIEHFKQWQQKINRKYSRILDEFISSSGFLNWEAIEAELDSIEKMTLEMKDILKVILKKYENHRIRRLIEGYQRALSKSSEILAIINIVYQSKYKIETILSKLQGKKDVKKILKNFRNQKIEETRQVFKKYSANKYEDQIVDKVAEAISEMTNLTMDAIDKLESMKHIVERIQQVLRNKDQNIGMKGLDKINQIFQSILEEARVFKQSKNTIAENNFFNEEFKRKAEYYEKQMQSKKGLVIQYIFGIVDSILSSMIETFQQYYSINEPLNRNSQSFSQLKSGLRNLAKNLVKQELPQGRLILNFVDSISQNLQGIKNHSQQLISLKASARSGINFDSKDYLNIVKSIATLTTSYKLNIKELIRKFAKMRAQLHSRQNPSEIFSRPESTQLKNEQPPESDLQTQYISNLYQLCSFFCNAKLQNTPVFAQTKVNIKQIGNTPKDLSNAATQLKKVIAKHDQFKTLSRNNEIKDITGNLKCSKLLQNVQQLLKLIETGQHIDEKNIQQKIKQCKDQTKKLFKQVPETKNVYEKIILSKLNKVLKLDAKESSVTQIQKMIVEEKNCSKEIQVCSYKLNFIKDLQNNLQNPIDGVVQHNLSTLSHEYSQLIAFYDAKCAFDNAINIYYPNSEYVCNLVSSLFDWIFVNDFEKNKTVQHTIQVYKRIMSMQMTKLKQLKNSRIYKGIEVVRKKTDHVEIQSQKLRKSFEKFLDEAKHCDRIQITTKYSDFLNDCLDYLTETKQFFFCLLSKQDQPVIITQPYPYDHASLISQFLTQINMPFYKHQLKVYKDQWKQVDRPIKKQPPKPKAQTKVSPKKGRKDEPSELIEEVEQEEIVDDMMEENIQENMDEEIPQQDDLIEDMPEDEMGDDVMAEDIQEEKDADQQIQQIEEEVEKPAKKKRPQSAYKKVYSPPKQSEKIQNKEVLAPKRPKKSKFVRLSQITSIKMLINSLINYQGANKCLKEQFVPSVYENMCNIFFRQILTTGKQPTQAGAKLIIAPCKENIAKINKGLDQKLKENIFKQIINNHEKHKALMTSLKELNETTNRDPLNSEVCSKIGSIVSNLFKSLDLQANAITKKGKIVYFSRDTQIKTNFLEFMLAQFDVKFSKEDLQDMSKQYFVETSNQNVFELNAKQEALNKEQNNKVYKDIQKMFGQTNWGLFIKLSDIKKQLFPLWTNQEGFGGRAFCPLPEVQIKNKQKIESFKNILSKLAIQYSKSLSKQFKKFQSKLSEAEKQLYIQTENIDSKSIDEYIRRVSGNELLKGIKLKLCQDMKTGLYFMMSTVDPIPLVKELAIKVVAINHESNQKEEIYAKLFDSVKPTEIKNDEIYIYSLSDIATTLGKIVNQDEQIVKQVITKDILNIVNNQMFNKSVEGHRKGVHQLETNIKFLQSITESKLSSNSQMKRFITSTQKLIKNDQNFLANFKKLKPVNNWPEYSKAAELLQDHDFLPKAPFAYVYSKSGNLYRMIDSQDPKQVQKQICGLLQKRSITFDTQNTSNGGTKYIIPSHTIPFSFAQKPLQKAIQYFGDESLSAKMHTPTSVLYCGPLQPTVQMQYEFPHIPQLTVQVLHKGQALSSQTFKDVGPTDSLKSQKAERAVVQIVEKETQRREEEERLRREKEERERREKQERERKEREERERIEREERERKEKEERDRREREQAEARRREDEEKKKREEEEKQRIRVEEEKRKRYEQQKERIRLEEEKQKKLAQGGDQNVQEESGENNKIALQQEVVKLKEQKQQKKAQAPTSRLRPKKPASKEALRVQAQKSRQKAEKDTKFKQYEQELLKKDIMLKTPQQILYQRDQQDKPSELAEFELYEQSMTPSQGYNHSQIQGQNLKQVDFLKMIKEKAGQDKFNRLKKRLEQIPNVDDKQ